MPVTMTQVAVVVDTAALPTDRSAMTSAIDAVPDAIEYQGVSEHEVQLQIATPGVTFNRTEPIVWVDAPRPGAFRASQVSEDGLTCTFVDTVRKGDDGIYPFLIRVQFGSFNYLSTDPTIYNKGDKLSKIGL